jgi:hypothetical protein
MTIPTLRTQTKPTAKDSTLLVVLPWGRVGTCAMWIALTEACVITAQECVNVLTGTMAWIAI